EPEIQLLERAARHHGHGAALVLAGVAAGTDPLEKRLPAVDLDLQERARQGVHGPLGAAADRPAQGPRRRGGPPPVDALDELAEEVVEQGVLGAGVVVAVPPEPVAALGDVDLLPRLAEPVGGDEALLAALAEVLAGAVQGVPGGVVFLVADPDGEVVVDPAAG